MTSTDTTPLLTELADLSTAKVARRRDELIFRAHAEGVPVADIQQAAGFSREASVYEAVRRHRERGEDQEPEPTPEPTPVEKPQCRHGRPVVVCVFCRSQRDDRNGDGR